MLSIAREAVPQDSLLKTHRGVLHPDRWGAYGDCFSVSIDRMVNLDDFVFAFYTSPLFRIERLMLRVLAGAPATDVDARALAQSSASTFSIWYAGERTATQLLMCDRYERTRSWFQVVPLVGGKTLLRFGSAVAATPGRTSPRAAFRLLLGFHIVYSQLLLSAARFQL